MSADARSYITSVTATDTRVEVKLGPQYHSEIIRVSWGRDIRDFPAWSKDVEILWSGTSDRRLEFAEEFALALTEAVRLVKGMLEVARGGGDFTVSFVRSAPDYVLAMLLAMHGQPVFYARDREVDDDMRERGLVDLDDMRSRALGLAEGSL